MTYQVDARTPYCSEQCRQGDLNSTTPNAQALTSTTPLSSCVQLPKNPRRLTVSRPPLAPVVPPVVVTPTSDRVVRDRRAFSFPATQILESSSPKARRDSTLLPAFARKPQATHYATTTNTTPVLTGLKKPSLRVPSGNGGLSKSSGATTPLALDSVFCSTSESSDNEGLGLGLKSKMGTGSTARPGVTRATRAARPSLPADFHRTSKTPTPQSFTAKSPSYLSSKQYAQRKQSQSPISSSVAAAIASSSSSRSREDIMAWAKAVKEREGDVEVNDEEVRNRGRARTRRQDSATNQSIIEEEPLSTTPKGPLQSVFAGLTSGRLGPIVKALTSVTGTGSTAPPPHPPSSGGLGLHSVPAPATVSKVDVTTSSTGYVNDDNLLFFGGTTPTLSTISFSEANEPTIATDNVDHDHVDMVTDDQQSAYSSHYRRGSAQAKIQSQHSPTPKVTEAPSTQRHSAIWNLSNYIRSFAPFALPTPGPQSSKTSTTKTSPSTSTSTPMSEPIAAAAPVPASRVESPAQSPPKELVRSVPMDIIVPQAGPLGEEFRARQAYATAQVEADRRRSRSGRASRSRSRSRTRSRSRGRSRGRSIAANAHARQVSYDADGSSSDDDDTPAHVLDRGRTPKAEGRGRTSQAKVLGGDDGLATGLLPPVLDNQSRSRGRNDEVRQSRSRGQRADSPARGRGRDRGVRA